MTQDDLALRITGLRPGKTPFLQPFGTDPESAAIPDEYLTVFAVRPASSNPSNMVSEGAKPVLTKTGQVVASVERSGPKT